MILATEVGGHDDEEPILLVVEGRRLLPGPDADPPVVAVLPFRSLGDDSRGDYFGDALTEELITQLGRR